MAENEINCAIGRHAVLKSTGQQISPHTRKEQCDQYAERDEVWGCAKPFRVVRDAAREWIAVKCDYI